MDTQRPVVRLSDFDLETGERLAVKRLKDSMNRKINARLGRSFYADYTGATCEVACCKWRNVYPKFGVGDFKEPDVDGLQVRGTTKKTGELVVRDNDKDTDVFVLVHWRYPKPEFEILGWATGGKVRAKGEYKDPGNYDQPAWFLSQEHLADPALLDGFLVERRKTPLQ